MSIEQTLKTWMQGVVDKYSDPNAGGAKVSVHFRKDEQGREAFFVQAIGAVNGGGAHIGFKFLKPDLADAELAARSKDEAAHAEIARFLDERGAEFFGPPEAAAFYGTSAYLAKLARMVEAARSE
jgi:hypothetical protein